jgi:hypothetical protein
MINLLYKSADHPDIDVPGHIIIEPEHAKHHAANCTNVSAVAESILKEACEIHGSTPPLTIYEQIIGYVDLTWKLWLRGHSVQWRYPESGLHPKHQLLLGDVLIMLDKARTKYYHPYIKEP